MSRATWSSRRRVLASQPSCPARVTDISTTGDFRGDDATGFVEPGDRDARCGSDALGPVDVSAATSACLAPFDVCTVLHPAVPQQTRRALTHARSGVIAASTPFQSGTKYHNSADGGDTDRPPCLLASVPEGRLRPPLPVWWRSWPEMATHARELASAPASGDRSVRVDGDVDRRHQGIAET